MTAGVCDRDRWRRSLARWSVTGTVRCRSGLPGARATLTTVSASTSGRDRVNSVRRGGGLRGELDRVRPVSGKRDGFTLGPASVRQAGRINTGSGQCPAGGTD
ncbi:hypothetical protein ElyMa_005788000 [Elysia marginata]|uniref:Uncharacterized protein n=1 Tax=Elysia marginata TaxID=1093978 RepID=A0AAV4FSW3_9GAST|nr:hypothetical protein ElyMa_005788000 [Elysia marginata]